MTRDDAITENYKYFRTALQIQGMTRSEDELRKMAAAQTDLYAALGMLKLDEPKSLPQKLRDFVSDPRLAQGEAIERLNHLQHVLHDCGLKITEK